MPEPAEPLKPISDTVIPASPASVPRPGRASGSRTRAGKAHVGLNAIRHGLTARRLVLPGERRAEWDEHADAFRRAVVPRDAIEEFLLRVMTDTAWRYQRVPRFENSLLALEDADQLLAAGDGERWLVSSDAIGKMIRYEAHLLRQFHRARQQLAAYRAAPSGENAGVFDVEADGTIRPAE